MTRKTRAPLRSGLKLSSALAAALTASTLSPCASAHGGFPRAFEILVEPGNANDIILRSDLWGFFRSMDGGKTWQWTCAEVYSSNSLGVDHRNMALLPGGRLLVANEFKGLRLTDDSCSWKEVMDLHGELVEDVTTAGTNVFTLTSTYKSVDGGNGGIDGAIWKSADKGDHFTRTGTALPVDFAGSALKFAPSDSTRLYVIGRLLQAAGGTMQRSDDGGTTWKVSNIPVTNDLMTLRLAAVHPTRPDVVFVWGDLAEGFGVDAPDELWGTTDGGATWSKVFTAIGDLPGFALSPDGTELLIAGPKDGVQHATVDDALSKGQSAFTQQFPRQVWGLHWTDTALTAGNDNFTARGIPAFTYGTSPDDGKSFTQLMSICETKYDACGAGTDVRVACDGVYDNPVGGFLQDFTHGPRCAAEAGADAGGAAAPASTSGGCAVGQPSGEGARTTGAGLLGIVLSALGLRSLRRARR